MQHHLLSANCVPGTFQGTEERRNKMAKSGSQGISIPAGVIQGKNTVPNSNKFY